MGLGKGGVKTTNFRAPNWSTTARVGALNPPATWAEVIGTPITMGENDIHGDCVAVAAFNAVSIVKARAGDKTPFDPTEPFNLYQILGGMPADEGLDPAVLFNYWKDNAIGGYKLATIYEISLTDENAIKNSIIDTGFVYFTATLDQAQMTQTTWYPVGGQIEGDHATILTWYEANLYHDATWGNYVEVTPEFIAKQGSGLWRIELTKVS